MASGAGGSAARERQLKKVYDCLNNGCNKKAVQEIDRSDRTFREMTVFKALKSLALIRMYKRKQAFDILEEINPNDNLDETTLQTMTSCYKESVDVGKIVDLYEAAVRRRPNDAEMMAHLFMAHVRVFNFKRQREIALQMYKSFPNKKRLYSFWAIMSLVMQSSENPEAQDRKVCLSLAEKMCEKMMDEERTNEEIELYLMILRKQNKHEEEYRFLTGPVCLRITDHLSWFNRRRAYLCLDLKMYSRAFKHYFPTQIQEYPDQIEYYQGLFRSAFLLDTEAPSQSNNPTTGTPVKTTPALAECYDIVEKQCQSALETNNENPKPSSKSLSRTSSSNPSKQRQIRGPFIARIELYHTIVSNEKILPPNVFNQCRNQFVGRFSSITSLLLDYFQIFGKKVICFYDMDYMISKLNLSSEEKAELVDCVGEWVQSLEASQKDQSSFDMFNTVLNYHMLKHSLRRYEKTDTREQRLLLARDYMRLYEENKHFGKSTNKTEFLPVDHYCLLAVNSVMTNPVDLDDSLLVSLIVLLESAIASSPSNHQLKLILLKLYSFIGASKQCSEVLLSLDIKHFQIDTLGHLLNPVLYNTGNYSLSRESLETCLEFYSHGIRECFEGLTTSYRDGKFSKIEEISGVLKRLSHSLNAAQCTLLKGIVANLSASNLEELKAAAQSFDPFKGLQKLFDCEPSKESIKDSRDFRVLKSLHMATNELIQRRQLETLEDEKIWLRLRYFILKSIILQSEHHLSSEKKDKNSRRNLREELDQLQAEIEQLLPQIELLEGRPSEPKECSFLEPEPVPYRWEHLQFAKLINLVKPVVFCKDFQNMSNQIQEDYCKQLETLVSSLEAQLASINSLTSFKQALLSLTISIEMISLCISSLVTAEQVDTKIVNKTEVQLTKLSHAIKAVDPKATILDKVDVVDQLLDKAQAGSMLPKIKEKILSSYSDSLKDIDGTCKRKAKLLRGKT